MAWANRLGGPGTNRGRPSRGAMTRVASWPSTLSFGPVSTRARKPSASTTISPCQPVIKVSDGQQRHPCGNGAGGLLIDRVGKADNCHPQTLVHQ